LVEREFEGEEIDYYMLYDILLTNKSASSFHDGYGYDYDAIYLLDYIKEKDYKGPKYNILEIDLQDNTTNKFICSRFMTNKLNFEAETLKEALELKKYIENECWITTLMNYYGDSILSQDRSMRYRLTREKLLDILNTTEDNIKNGFKIQDIVPFFKNLI
jgi:deoxyhypusine synthase